MGEPLDHAPNTKRLAFVTITPLKHLLLALFVCDAQTHHPSRALLKVGTLKRGVSLTNCFRQTKCALSIENKSSLPH